LELRHIRHLMRVADHGNYARAADDLGITQSALTQSIAKLEGELGVKLLDRGRFGAVLTEAGQLLLTRGRQIDAEARLATQEIEAFKGGTRGDVRIGVGKSLVHGLLPDAIARFARLRQDVVVTAFEGISGDLFARLLRGELDFVVSAPGPGTAVDPDLSQKPLFEQHAVVVAGPTHPLATAETVTLADLRDTHWVVTPTGMGRVMQLRATFTAAGIVPPTRFIRTDSSVLMDQLVMRGAGIGLATAELLQAGGPGFVELRVPELLETRWATITKRRRSRLQPLAAALENTIMTVAAELFGNH